MRDPQLDTQHLRGQLGRLATRAMASVAMAQIISNMIMLGGTIILARLLDPQAFGLIAMITTVMALLHVFENFGFSVSVVQKDTLSPDELNFMFWLNLGIASAMGGILALLSGPISTFYQEPILQELCYALSAAFVVRGATSLHSAVLNRQLQHAKTASAGVIANVGATILAITLAYYGAGVWALVSRQLADVSIKAMMIWWFCGWRPRLSGWQAEYRQLIGFGKDVTLSNLMHYLSRNADDIIVGKAFGADPLGQYKLSYKILLVPLRQCLNPITQVMVPVLSQMLSEPPRYRRTYIRMVTLLHVLLSATGIAFMIHADTFIDLLFGPSWQASIAPMRWLAASLLVMTLNNTAGWLFISQSRTQTMMRMAIVSSVTTSASFIAGLPYGIHGVAAAYSIVLIARTPLLLYVLSRSGPMRHADLYIPVMRSALPLAVFSAVNLGLYALSHDSGLFWRVLCFGSGFITLFATITLDKSLRETCKEAIRMVRKHTKKNK